MSEEIKRTTKRVFGVKEVRIALKLVVTALVVTGLYMAIKANGDVYVMAIMHPGQVRDFKTIVETKSNQAYQDTLSGLKEVSVK